MSAMSIVISLSKFFISTDKLSTFIPCRISISSIRESITRLRSGIDIDTFTVTSSLNGEGENIRNCFEYTVHSFLIVRSVHPALIGIQSFTVIFPQMELSLSSNGEKILTFSVFDKYMCDWTETVVKLVAFVHSSILSFGDVTNNSSHDVGTLCISTALGWHMIIPFFVGQWFGLNKNVSEMEFTATNLFLRFNVMYSEVWFCFANGMVFREYISNGGWNSGTLVMTKASVGVISAYTDAASIDALVYIGMTCLRLLAGSMIGIID